MYTININIKIKTIDYIVMETVYNQYENEGRDKIRSKLVLVQAISRILSSLLLGVADASKKCIDYPSCIKGQEQQMQGQQMVGGFGITDAGTIGANIVENIERGLITTIKIIGVFSDSIAPVIEEVVFGDLADKPWNEVAPKITRIINEKKDYLDKMSRDPEIQKALKEWAEAYATIGIQTTEAIRPSLDMMIDEALDALSKAGSRAATGAINTGMNITEAAIGEIPVAGGIISLIIALVRGVNQAFVAAAPMVQFGTEAVGTGYKTTKKVMNIVEEGKRKLDETTQKLQNLTDKFKNIGEISQTTLENVQNIGKQIGTNVISGAVEGAVQGAVKGAEKIVPPMRVPTVQRSPLVPTVQRSPLVPTVQRSPPIQQSQINVAKQLGGARKKLHAKINHTTRRIKNTLNKFNNNKNNKNNNKNKKKTRRVRFLL